MAPSKSHQIKRVFVSYRVSQKDLALRMSGAAEAVGWISDTVEEDLNCPYPRGSPEESKWLTDEFAKRIEPGCTFVALVSEDAAQSRWLLWEAVEGFTKAYRVIVVWLSGSEDPLKIVFPLSRRWYRFIDSPQSFIVDARSDAGLAIRAVTKILGPSRRYRIIFRLQQISTVVISLGFVLFPVTVLLGTSVVSADLAASIRAVLLRPWICLLTLWFGIAFSRVFYPSYGGPSRLAPDCTDKHIRLITAGFTGWRWHKLCFPFSFIVMCSLNGIGLFSIQRMATIGFKVYLEAAALALVLRWAYERARWNMLTVHLGTIFRKLLKHYNVSDQQFAKHHGA